MDQDLWVFFSKSSFCTCVSWYVLVKNSLPAVLCILSVLSPDRLQSSIITGITLPLEDRKPCPRPSFPEVKHSPKHMSSSALRTISTKMMSAGTILIFVSALLVVRGKKRQAGNSLSGYCLEAIFQFYCKFLHSEFSYIWIFFIMQKQHKTNNIVTGQVKKL